MGFDPYMPAAQNTPTSTSGVRTGYQQPAGQPGGDLPSGYRPTRPDTGTPSQDQPPTPPPYDPKDPRTWSPDQWVHNLMDPSVANAHGLEEAINACILTRDQARQYLVQKDQLLRQNQAWNRVPYRSWGGGAFSGAAPIAQPGLSAWALQPLGGNWNVPSTQLNLSDASMGGVPQPYQGNLYAWLATQGWSPSGSLGQYGYRNWTNAMPYTFDETAFNSITDPSLRAWAKALFGQGAAPSGS